MVENQLYNIQQPRTYINVRQPIMDDMICNATVLNRKNCGKLNFISILLTFSVVSFSIKPARSYEAISFNSIIFMIFIQMLSPCRHRHSWPDVELHLGIIMRFHIPTYPSSTRIVVWYSRCDHRMYDGAPYIYEIGRCIFAAKRH